MSTHCDEICNKIVSIMCDRLTTTPQDLAGLLAAVPRAGLDPSATTPSSFAASTVKQLQILSDILSSTSSPQDRDKVLTTVAQKFSSALGAAYGGREAAATGREHQLAADLGFLAASFQSLPVEPDSIRGAVRELQSLHARFLAAAHARAEAAADAQAAAEAEAVADAADRAEAQARAVVEAHAAAQKAAAAQEAGTEPEPELLPAPAAEVVQNVSGTQAPAAEPSAAPPPAETEELEDVPLSPTQSQ